MSEAIERLHYIVREHKEDRLLGRTIALNIKSRRKELGLTQAGLADILRIKQPHIARLERSSYGRHTIHSLSKIATALDTTVERLVHLTEVEPPRGKE